MFQRQVNNRCDSQTAVTQSRGWTGWSCRQNAGPDVDRSTGPLTSQAAVTRGTCYCVGFNGERLRALGICYQGFNFHLFIFSHVTNERPSVYQHRRCRNPSNSFPPFSFLVFVFYFFIAQQKFFLLSRFHSQALSSVTFVRYLGETAYTLMCVSHPPTNATSLRTRPLLIPPARCTPAARISRRVDKVATNRDILPPRRRRLQFESIHDNARTLARTLTHTTHTRTHTATA